MRLLDRIDEQLAKSVHRVLVRAVENVGACTYAEHMPGYLRARKELYQIGRNWWSRAGYRTHNREYRVVAALIHHHREMYRQPCLLCSVCQSRTKFWRDAAYSPFGQQRGPVDF